MSEATADDHIDGAEVSDNEEVTPGYAVPEKVTAADMLNKDKDDEALEQYKKSLMGNPASVGGSLAVTVLKMTLISLDDQMRKEIDLQNVDLSKLKDNPISVKEGIHYRIEFVFRVDNDIVTGLKYHHVVKRKGISVDKETHMLGSYAPNGPDNASHTCKSPESEMPSGMLARGSYVVHSKFLDDDKNTFYHWEWAFKLSSDWK